MIGGAFDRLLYTDCRAGTGRGAGGGFQVQAQSAGVDSAQAKMAVGWLLYDAPGSWIAQRRPVEDFPLGFAHAAEAGYGTSQSRYVGTEATGARQGNHLADCLLTRDPDVYGPTRPAQLWRSPLWRSEAWDTTDCPQFEDTPPLGPLTVDAVAEWLRGHPERAPALARLLSVLEQPSGRRVVIAAAGTDEALLWITAATLLLPLRSALGVSFKVFCSNPQQARQRVIAVPKELHPQVAPGRGGSVFVLDADDATSDTAEISDRARFWVGRFATAEDPYDVVDAVELAGLMGTETDPDGADAMITAWALTSPDAPLDDPAALLRWLKHADPKLQQEHGPEVVRRIMGTDAPAATLQWIDAAAGEHFDADRPAVRARLLTAEIAEVRAGGTVAGDPLPDIDTDASARRDADSELSSAILLGSDPEVDLLLRLCWRHGVEPELSPLSDRLSAFAIGWVDHPGRDYHPAGWALREPILDLVHDELQERLATRGPAGIEDALRRLWRHMADRPSDLADPLDCYIQVALIRSLKGEQRLSRLNELIRQAGASPRARQEFTCLQGALVEGQVLGPAEALAVLQALPETVPVAPEAIEAAVGEIERRATRPTAATLNALGVLYRRGIAPRDKPFADLLKADSEVLGFIEATRTTRFGEDNSWARRCVKQLGRAEPAVIQARLRALVGVCLECPAPGLGAAVLAVLPASLPGQFIDRWGLQLGGADGIRAATWGVYWADDAALDKLRPRIATTFREFASKLGPDAEEEWFTGVQRALDPELADMWADLADHEPTRSRRGHWFRGRDA
jgi:GTPase-associated protein 1, N-terminal domain type 2/GTPase-associated protein 1, middle domain